MKSSASFSQSVLVQPLVSSDVGDTSILIMLFLIALERSPRNFAWCNNILDHKDSAATLSGNRCNLIMSALSLFTTYRMEFAPCDIALAFAIISFSIFIMSDNL